MKGGRASFPAKGGLAWRALNRWPVSPRIWRWPALLHQDRGRSVNLAAMRRILVVKLDEIGDFVLATPFLRELRAAAPQAWVSLVVTPTVVNLAETCPYVNEVLPFDPSAGPPHPLGPLLRHRRAWRWARKHLAPHPADIAFLPRWDLDEYLATFVALFGHARRVVAFSEHSTPGKKRDNRGFDHLVSHAVTGQPQEQHEVLRNLGLLDALGVQARPGRLELWPTAEEHAWAAQALAGDLPWVALAPGARTETRRWPERSFSELSRLIEKHLSARCVVIGAPHDPCVDGTVRFRTQSLRQSVALLQRCRLAVVNDSGPKHLAAAAGCPVVEMLAVRSGVTPQLHTHPDRFFAWGVPRRVVRPPPGVGETAINEITVQAAWSEVEDLWRQADMQRG
jgi:heptosyltransferase-2